MSDDPASKGALRPRNVLLAIVVVLLLGALYLATSEDAQRAAELRAAELAGDLATRVVANAGGGSDGQERDSRFVAVHGLPLRLDPEPLQRSFGSTRSVKSRNDSWLSGAHSR